MVSLTERQALADLSIIDPQLGRFQIFLSGGRLPEDDPGASGVHEELLIAIASNDAVRFKDAAEKIGKRKASVDSDWCQDDYLMFLLALGNEIFGRPLTYLSSLIEVRQNNQNPFPRKINEVFAALVRQEFGIDGEFGFLKIPFLRLAGKLRLGPVEAAKALNAMSAPQLLDQMSPFLKLLTQTAYDLVLTERNPLETETITQLIEGFEAHAKQLSLRQWSIIVSALPGRMIWAVVAAIISLGLIPVLFGVGKGLVTSRKTEEVRKRPASLVVTSVREPSTDLPVEALELAKYIDLQSGDRARRTSLFLIEAAPFPTATPSFIAEVSHPTKSIKSAFAFTEGISEGVRPFTIIPVQRDSGRFRAILPEQPKRNKLRFVVELELDPAEDSQGVGKNFLLRPLQ